MDALAEELMQEMNVKTSFTIPLFGGIPIPESVFVTWIIIAVLAVLCFVFTRNLQVVPNTKRQIIVETAVEGMNRFFMEFLAKKGNHLYRFLRPWPYI